MGGTKIEPLYGDFLYENSTATLDSDHEFCLT